MEEYSNGEEIGLENREVMQVAQGFDSLLLRQIFYIQIVIVYAVNTYQYQ